MNIGLKMIEEAIRYARFELLIAVIYQVFEALEHVHFRSTFFRQ